MCKILVFIGYLLLSIFNFGAITPEAQHDFYEETSRNTLGFRVFVSALPIAGTVATLVITNFLQYGWSLEYYNKGDN